MCKKNKMTNDDTSIFEVEQTVWEYAGYSIDTCLPDCTLIIYDRVIGDYIANQPVFHTLTEAKRYVYSLVKNKELRKTTQNKE